MNVLHLTRYFLSVGVGLTAGGALCATAGAISLFNYFGTIDQGVPTTAQFAKSVVFPHILVATGLGLLLIGLLLLGKGLHFHMSHPARPGKASTGTPTE